MASNSVPEILPCLECLRHLADVEDADTCRFMPGSDTCNQCEDVGYFCVKGEKLPPQLVLEGLKIHEAMHRADFTPRHIVHLKERLEVALRVYDAGAVPQSSMSHTEDDNAHKTGVHKANIKERLAGFYKAVGGFKKLEFDDAYMDSGKVCEVFKAGAESVMELLEMPDEEEH